MARKTGTAKNDLLTGGSSDDQLFGLAGGDVLIFDAMDSFDGGTGSDTLRVTGAGRVAALTTFSSGRLAGIEVLDLAASGAQKAVLNATTIGALTSGGNFLRVEGTASDTLQLIGAFDAEGTVELDGRSYRVFNYPPSNGAGAPVADYALTLRNNLSIFHGGFGGHAGNDATITPAITSSSDDGYAAGPLFDQFRR